MLILGFLAVTTVVLVAIVKVNEFRQKREDEAIGLQVRIDDALLAVPGLLCTSVAPTVRIPFRKSAPARIKLSGEAPSPYLEQKALQVTAQVASRFWPNFTIENHMVIAPSAGARAAGAVAPARAELVGAKGERTWLPAASHLRS